MPGCTFKVQYSLAPIYLSRWFLASLNPCNAPAKLVECSAPSHPYPLILLFAQSGIASFLGTPVQLQLKCDFLYETSWFLKRNEIIPPLNFQRFFFGFFFKHAYATNTLPLILISVHLLTLINTKFTDNKGWFLGLVSQRIQLRLRPHTD